MSHEYICKYGLLREEEVSQLPELTAFKENSYLLAIYTDKVECLDFAGLKQIEKLLEVRIWNEKAELKITRSAIERDFYYRLIDDRQFLNQETQNRIFDEKHYLDIDSTQSQGQSYCTTGGGRYSLPIERAERIHIRNYLDYDEQGIAKLNDFRIVALLQGSEKE